MFDGVHLGHRHLWQEISGQCGADGSTSLAVTFSRHPLEIIAPERVPLSLCPVGQRAELLRQAGADQVLVLDFTPQLRALTAAQFLRMLASHHGITHLVTGFNNSIGSDRANTPEAYARLESDTGVNIRTATEFRLPDGRTVSSSAIRNYIACGDLPTANLMLGRPYSLSGTVGHGKALGRTIGFPTANILPADARQVIPAKGVYALDVLLPDGSRRRAMANIGQRPTVERQADAPTTIEVNIFDFEGNLYDRQLTLQFLQRLRSEERFDSLDTLRNRLAADRQKAMKL